MNGPRAAAVSLLVMAAGCNPAPRPATERQQSAPAAAPLSVPSPVPIVGTDSLPSGAPTAQGAPIEPPSPVVPRAKPARPPPPQTAKTPRPPARQAAAAAPATATPIAPAALDLLTLKQRLKDTHAIGVFTKLTLKNQVDDLLDEFRAFHNSTAKAPPDGLRTQYDGLMMKVLSLLNDGDPALASAISSSRDAIWQVLVDPVQFSKL